MRSFLVLILMLSRLPRFSFGMILSGQRIFLKSADKSLKNTNILTSEKHITKTKIRRLLTKIFAVNPLPFLHNYILVITINIITPKENLGTFL